MLFGVIAHRRSFDAWYVGIKEIHFGSAHRFDDGVVPHALAIEKVGCNEKRCRQTMPLQYQQRFCVIVGIVIIKSDCHRARWQLACLQKADCLIQWQHVKLLHHPAHYQIETHCI